MAIEINDEIASVAHEMYSILRDKQITLGDSSEVALLLLWLIGKPLMSDEYGKLRYSQWCIRKFIAFDEMAKIPDGEEDNGD